MAAGYGQTQPHTVFAIPIAFVFDRPFVVCRVIVAGADTVASDDIITNEDVELVVKCSGLGNRGGYPPNVRRQSRRGLPA